jgi:myo-inositol-1(or 4)-monophosphatase
MIDPPDPVVEQPAGRHAEPMAVHDPTSMLDLAVGLAREAGMLARRGRVAATDAAASLAARATTATKSSATDLVTEFDRAAERLVVDGLRAARPADHIVGEEGTAADAPSSGVDGAPSGITWFVDPIDGTTNFVYDLPIWAVSIAAADAHGPLVAVVDVPVLGEVFTAIRGRGAFLGSRRLRCGDVVDPAVALVATGFAYDPDRRRRQAARIAGLLHQVRDVRRMGAASVDLCFVAAGRLDAYFEEGLGPWDLAAGHLVASEAGCRLGDFDGGPPRPAEVLVANPVLWEPLARLIRAAS